MHLIYSVRGAQDVIYADELEACEEAAITYTREAPAGWGGHTGRLDAGLVAAAAEPGTTAYVCGSNGFVEAASRLAMEAGVPGERIRTERFGPTGF
jgi:ferredoxin-NADP reductase